MDNTNNFLDNIYFFETSGWLEEIDSAPINDISYDQELDFDPEWEIVDENNNQSTSSIL